MTLLRRKIGERLVAAQHTAALLTTFNEIDLTAVQTLRQENQERFLAKYHIKLGLMSFFIKATVAALQLVPQLNAEIRGSDIVYHNYHDLAIAMGGGRGLVAPVLRDAGRRSFAELERDLADYALRVKENRIAPDDLHGSTFTIANGAVYGSLLSTPLVNLPQCGILGLHAIQEHPVAIAGQVVIRPVMHLALSYDHRLVDGREAVQFQPSPASAPAVEDSLAWARWEGESACVGKASDAAWDWPETRRIGHRRLLASSRGGLVFTIDIQYDLTRVARDVGNFQLLGTDFCKTGRRG